MRAIGLACLGQVRLVPAPPGAALERVARLCVIGGSDALARGRQLSGRDPPERAVFTSAVVLSPDLPQHIDLLEPGQVRRRVGGIEQGEQQHPVRTDALREREPLRIVLRQLVLLDPVAVARLPPGGKACGEPQRRRRGEGVQRTAQRLADEFEPVDVAHRGEHVRGICALPAAGHQETGFAQPTQQQVENQILAAADQPRPELGEHREIEAAIIQFEREGVLPVDPCAYGVRRLTVGQALGELQHAHQRQSPRRKRRPPSPGEQLGELAIFEELTERVAHPYRQSAMRKRRSRNPRRLLRDSLQTAGTHRQRRPLTHEETEPAYPSRPGDHALANSVRYGRTTRRSG